jgi:hypothetical protein
MSEKIKLAPGVALPFFPMRPLTGRPLTDSLNLAALVEELKTSTDVIQPKLNGDHAELAVVNGQIKIANRHGGWLSQRVRNADDFLRLPNMTGLVGEVYEGKFWPFDVVAYGGRSLCWDPIETREIKVKEICQTLGHEFIFNRPTAEWLLNRGGWNGLAVPKWEGVVRKTAGSFYVMAGSSGQDNREWTKEKWC